MKIYFFILLFLSYFTIVSLAEEVIPKWEETTPVDEVAPPIEETTSVPDPRYAPTRKSWELMRESFRGEEPLAFIEDPQTRDFLRVLTDRSDNPEEERKKWALAAYFAQNVHADIRACHGNLDLFLKKFYNNEPVSIDYAYRDIGAALGVQKSVSGWLILFHEELVLLRNILLGVVIVLVMFFLRRVPVAVFKFFRVLFNLPYSNAQKYFIGLTLVSVVMLLLALPDHWIDAGGYFVFLRIVCFASLIGLLLEKLPVWLKFPLLLLAILYNPVFQIHLRDRDVWRFFNVISIFFLLIPWCVVMKRLYVKSKNSLQNDSQTGLQNE